MFFRKNWIRTAIAVALTAVAQMASGAELQEVAIALPGKSLSSTIPIFVNDLGLFEKHGIKPRFVTLDTADATASALIAGSVQVAVSSVAPIIAAQLRGQKIIAINSMYKGLAGSMVLSKAVVDKLGVSPSAPVAERLKALDGLLIASSSPTSSYTLSYRGASTAAGGKPNFTYMQFPAMPAAMATGAIQGYIASAPFWLAPVVGGTGVLWLDGPKGELPAQFRPAHNTVSLVMEDYAKANPGVVRGINAAFADFSRSIDSRAPEIKDLIAKYFPSLDRGTIDVLFSVETVAWKTNPITPAELAHEIDYVKGSTTNLPPGIEKLDPASLLFR